MSVGDLVIDSFGGYGIVVCYVDYFKSCVTIKLGEKGFLVLFSDRKVWCGGWEFRVLDS